MLLSGKGGIKTEKQISQGSKSKAVSNQRRKEWLLNTLLVALWKEIIQ